MAMVALEELQRAEFGTLINKPAILRLTATSNGLPAANILNAGCVYRVVATTDCYVRQVGGGADAATTNASPLPAMMPICVPCTGNGDTNIIGITAGATCDVYVTRVR